MNFKLPPLAVGYEIEILKLSKKPDRRSSVCWSVKHTAQHIFIQIYAKRKKQQYPAELKVSI